jgi:hypothetical protein
MSHLAAPLRWERARGLLWPAAAVAIALVVVNGAFDASRIFYLRDLSAYFWPEHLWLRDAVTAGDLPVWDPYMAFGRSAVEDPLRHLFFPPTLLLRFVAPAALGFNLAVALPVPVMALGMYLFLKRHVAARAAATGSVVFAISGPAVSTAVAINLAWAAACLPWALAAVDRYLDRRSARAFALLAVAFAMQFLAAEAVLLVAASTLAVAYAAARGGVGARDRALAAAGVVAAGVVGLLLASVQALPLARAVAGSPRGAGLKLEHATAWSLHPLSALGAVVPDPFGDPVAAFGGASPWVYALNDGREPFLASVYFGATALALATLGALLARRRAPARFWTVVAVVALVCAFGKYTPIYTTAARLVPVLQSLRYPSKYTIVLAFAVAALAAYGVDVLESRPEALGGRRARAIVWALAALAVAVTAILSLAVIAPDAAASLFTSVAGAFGLRGLDASILTKALLTNATTTILAAGGAAGLLLLRASPRPAARLAVPLLLALVAVELVANASGLLPTQPVSAMGEPAWVGATREHPSDRVYVGNRFHAPGPIDRGVDDVGLERGTPVTPEGAAAYEASVAVFLGYFPAGWRAREAVSYDFASLVSDDYLALARRLRSAPREDRARFLGRVGVRYYVVPWTDWQGGTQREAYPDIAPLFLYEREPTPRASVATAATVEPDLGREFDRMFAPDFDPAAEVLLAGPEPAPEGVASAPGSPAAAISRDDAAEVDLTATAPEGGGYLVLADTFTPDWSAEVDGREARVVRADGLFRAVRLAPGAHEVRFRYRATALRAGALVTLVTALALAVALCRRPRRGGPAVYNDAVSW